MNRRFISIRWKLVSTYLLLVLLSVFVIIALINAALIEYFFNDKKNELLTQATIVSDKASEIMTTAPKEIMREELVSLIKSYSLNYEARLMVVDRHGNVITDAFDDYSEINVSFVPEVSSALTGKICAETYWFEDFGQTIYVSVPIYETVDVIGVVFISDAPTEIYKDINHILGDLYWIAVLIVIAAIVISLLLANLFAEPILDLTRVVKRVSIGQKGEKAKIYNNDELGILTDATNKMLAKQVKVDDLRKGFVSNVSHELRTPITSMKIIAQTMLESKPQDVAIYEDFMTDIDGELERLNQIIDTLLDSTNLENQGLKLKLEPTQIEEIVGTTIKTLTPIALKQNIALTQQIKATSVISVDRLKVGQVMINIINNALKYTEPGGRVDVSVEELKDEIIVKIKDTGVGIAEDDIPHLFDRFYRVDAARARSTGGSGLGLSIAQQIMVLHGGGIDVQSKQGEGSVFMVIFSKQATEALERPDNEA